MIHDDLSGLACLISELNKEHLGVIVVEGKRDSMALKNLGCTKPILEFHSFCGITKFADSVSMHAHIILLLDSDKKGKYLTKRIIEQLQRRAKIDLSYKKRLVQVTRGKIRAIEDLSMYDHCMDSLIVK